MILKSLTVSSTLITILCALTAEAEAEIDFIDGSGVNRLSVADDGTYVESSEKKTLERAAELAGLATMIRISNKSPTPEAYEAVCSLFQKLSQNTLFNKKGNYQIITTDKRKKVNKGIQPQVDFFEGAKITQKTASEQGSSGSYISDFDNLTGMLNNLPSKIESLAFYNAGDVLISDLGERLPNIFISGETVICEEGKGSEELKETHGGAISYLKITDNLKTLNYDPNVIKLLNTPIAGQTNQQKSGLWSLAKSVASVASNTFSGSYKGYAGLAIEYSDSRTTNLNSEQENNASALNLTLGENTSALYLVNEKAYNNIKRNMMNPVEALRGIFSEAQLKDWAKKSTKKNDFKMNPNAYYVQEGDNSFLWVVKSREDVFKSKKDKTAERISISFNETGEEWKVDGKEVK